VRETVDGLGLAFLTPGMAALVTAFIKGNNGGWDAPATLVTALVLFSIFIRIERRGALPTIDCQLLRHPLSHTAFSACGALRRTSVSPG
jgi:ABC-type uncharacterized transport system permease subunit